MYQPPQTFLYDDSPPSSPTERVVPTFQLSPAPTTQHEKSDHQRPNSVSKKYEQRHALPFSYEYVVKDGKIAGLAEYNPDNDYLHYSSSRGSSRTNSRNPSRRTSAEHSGRSSPATRYSSSSDRQILEKPAQPSKKTDKLKRALSITNLRGRSSHDEKRKPTASQEQIALSFYSERSPTHISKPMRSPTPQNASEPFESPRKAPKPPVKTLEIAVKDIPNTQRQPFSEIRNYSRPGPVSMKSKKSLPSLQQASSPEQTVKRSNTTLQRPGKVTQAPVAVVSPTSSGEPTPRPILKRKTSKFTEHIDDSVPTVQTPASATTPPLPSIPPFAFQLPKLPTSGENVKGPNSAGQNTTSPMVIDDHPEWPRHTLVANAKALNKAQGTQGHAHSLVARAQPHQPSQEPSHRVVARQRSATNMKQAVIIKPAMTGMLNRATSVRTPRTSMWADVRMAEVKPILRSPIVATGHARMISC